MKFTNSDKQKMIIAMDLRGYEQDGKGLDFIHEGERHSFKSYDDLFNFICKNFVNR